MKSDTAKKVLSFSVEVMPDPHGLRFPLLVIVVIKNSSISVFLTPPGESNTKSIYIKFIGSILYTILAKPYFLNIFRNA